MTRSKKIFAGMAVLFFLFLAYVVYDISSRTTFPGTDRENPSESAQDSTASSDTTGHAQP